MENKTVCYSNADEKNKTVIAIVITEFIARTNKNTNAREEHVLRKYKYELILDKIYF